MLGLSMLNLSGLGRLAFLGALLVVWVIIGIAVYLFYSFALFRLAQRRGVEMAWLAWIPIAQMYIIGLWVKQVKLSTFEIPRLEIVLPVGFLAVVILGKIPLLGLLVYIAYIILMLLTLNKLYNQYIPEQATMYTVLSILIITIPFFFLKLSNMDPVSVD